MALKCPYLAKKTISDVIKNGSSIWNKADRCPVMSNAIRMFSGYGSSSKSNGLSDATKQQDPQQQQGSNSIKCPFVNEVGAKKILVETNLDDCKDVIDVASYTKKNAFNYEKFFYQKIQDKKRDHSYRIFKKIERRAETFPIVREHTSANNHQDVTMWCSNDYLGLGRHTYVQDRVIEAIKNYGVGSGGTRNISGSTPFHTKLEQDLCELHQKEAALVFTSCYVANDTTLFTLAKMLPNCHIFSDSGNHASMIQGIRNSQVPKHIFRHNDYEHLEELLSQLPMDTPKIVAFESVHSMDGSICDVGRMCDITHKYGGIAFIDEVHAVGLYGQNGAGIGERDSVLDKMDIISGTLGKAFGNIGGYVAGSAAFIDMIRSYGSGFIFTTSLPPSVAIGASAAIQVSRSDEGRQLRIKHQANAAILKQKLIDANLPVMNSPSHIVPVFVGNAQRAADICNLLLQDYNIYIQSINYPTVARGEERLRIVPTPLHTMEMIDNLVDSLKKAWYDCYNEDRIKSGSLTCKTCKLEAVQEDWRKACPNFNLRKCGAILA